MKTVVEKLVDIINDYPLAIRPMIVIYTPLSGNQYLRCEAKGVTLQTPWKFKDGSTRYGIGLSSDCDDMPTTYIHEAFHILYPQTDEAEIERLTNQYKIHPDLRKACLEKILEKNF